MAISSGISVKTISDSVSKTRSAAAETGKTTIKISNLLNKNISDKRNISSDIKSLKNKRIEREKRNILIDRMSKPLIAVKPRGARILSASDPGTSVINRLLNFVGYLTGGWILGNLPTWIGLGEQFITRLTTAGSILSNYGDELVKVMTDTGDVFMASVQNISRFDFSDSSFLVRSSLNELKLSIDSLGEGINSAFQVLIQPFKAIEKVPDAYGKLPSILPGFEPPEPSPGGGNQNRSISGTKEQRAALDAIAFAEGTMGKNGYSTWAGYQKHGPDDLTGLTIRQVHDLQTSFIKSGKVKKTGSAVVGRYQFLTPYNQAKAAGLNPETDKFSPANQDKMAIHIMDQYGVTDNVLKKEGMSARVSRMLGQQWAPFPGSPYGQRTKSLKSIQKAYQDSLGSRQTISTPSPANSLLNLGSPAAAIASLFTGQKPAAIPAGQRPLAKGDVFTKSLGKGVDFIEVSSLVGDGRGHGGIDIAAPSGTYISLRVDCEVVAQGRYGNYGLLIDVWIPSLGIQLRMAHLSSVIIKNGRIPAGTSFARVGTSGRVTGPHIHLEYDTKKGTRGGGSLNDDPQNYAANLDQYVRLLYLTSKPIGRAFSGTTPLVPGAPSVSTQQQTPEVDMESTFVLKGLLGGLSQKREGRKVVVVDDRQPNNMAMIPTSGGNMIGDISIDESSLLNTFIKNKFLLDLTYV
jgi:murein DD-endopeptidase MepM/ murein hydrolase activator NlpD